MSTNQPSIAATRVDFRKVKDAVQEVKLGDWVEIKGRVAQVIDDDALVSAEGRDELIYLKNCPGARGLIDGSRIDCTAICTGIKEYRSVLGANKRVLQYDAGTKPNVTELRAAQLKWDEEQERVTAAREKEQSDRQKLDRQIAEARTKELAEEASRRNAEAKAKRMQESERIARFQLQQASNGLPSFQYEVAMRYLKGEGVESNRTLAIYWLQSACTNGDSSASNALSKLSQ